MGLQYGIKEVLNLNFVDYATNKPFAFVDYAEASSNENSMERLDLRGGWGNAKLMSFDHTKDSTLNLTIPLVDLKLLAMLGGEDVTTGASDVLKREILPVTLDGGGDPIVTLTEVPVNGTVYLFQLEGLRDNGDEIDYTDINGKVVELSTPVAEGTQIVAFYQYATPTSAKKFSIKANKFPKAVKLYGQGLWRNQEDEKDYLVHVTVHKARPQGNFTFNMNATDATTLELTFDMYAVADANGDQQYIDYVVETE